MIRAARQRHALSQRALARRAGTTQAWISAIERGRVHPTTEMLRRLLLVMGEELVLGTRPLPSDADHDRIAFEHAVRQTPAERLDEALAWMRLAR